MKKIDSSTETILGVTYDLYSVQLSELKSIAKSWYEGVDLKKFDDRFIRERDSVDLTEMKKSGLVCNLFYAYQEGDKTFLLDGFNRLFTEYGQVEDDITVYLKMITSKLEDHQLMEVMYRLNMWKISDLFRNYGGFKVDNFLDRGFRLLLYSKFNIEFYSYTNVEYENRIRENHDIHIIDQYFIYEADYSADFKTSYQGVQILMSQPNIINDFKAILKGNDYLKAPFKNYSMFLDGYVRYLAYLRYKGYDKVLEFEDVLQMLYNDKKFFKKLQGMSWTDSTRKNIYHFFRNLKLEVNDKD